MKLLLNRTFIIILLSVEISLLFFFLIIYRLKSNLELEEIKSHEKSKLEIFYSETDTKIKSVVNDLSIFKNHPVILDYFVTKNKRAKDQIPLILKNLLEARNYNKLRIINENGQEIFKVAKVNNNAEIARDSELENIGEQRFFRELTKLTSEDVLFSKVNLKQKFESGNLQRFPVIFISREIVRLKSQRLYVVVDNSMMDAFRFVLQNNNNPKEKGKFLVLNKDSYCLLGNNKVKNSDFIINKNELFSEKKPRLWKQMKEIFSSYSKNLMNKEAEVKQLQDQGVLYTFFSTKSQEYYGKANIIDLDSTILISTLNFSEYVSGKLFYMRLVYFIIFFLAAIASFIISRDIIKEKVAKEKIIKLERKNSVLAMVVTANHEINQPLTVAKAYTEILMRVRSQTTEKTDFKIEFEKEKQILGKIQKSVNKIDKILKKYQTKEFEFSNYTDDVKMVNFQNESTIVSTEE